MGFGGSSGNYQTSYDHVASAGVAKNDYAVRTNTIPGGWDGSDPLSTSYTVYHNYQFTNLTQPALVATLSGAGPQINMPTLTLSAFDPAEHERWAFGERYGVDYNNDGWAYCTGYSWKVYNDFGGDITSQCLFWGGGVVTHPVGTGTTYDLSVAWYTRRDDSSNFPAGSRAELTLNRQRYDDNGPQIDITGDYNGFNVPVASGGPDVRLELKTGRDGNAGDGPYFGVDVLILGTFDVTTQGLPVPVGAGKPTTIITS